MHHHHHPYLLSASSGSIGSTFEGESPFFVSTSTGGLVGEVEVDYRVYDSYSKRMEPIRPHENDVLMGRGTMNTNDWVLLGGPADPLRAMRLSFIAKHNC